MTKSEFIQRSQAGMRNSLRLFLLGVVSLGISLLSAAIFGTRENAMTIMGCGSSLGLFFLFLSCSAEWFVPKCSHCGRRLEGRSALEAVATGNCAHCRQRAFDDAAEAGGHKNNL
jgi:hypothetical protein